MLAHSAAERDQLLKQHFGLVHHVARKMQKHLSTEASFDDLVSAGSVGLMSAAENFDPARGLAFSTFALPRIRGAILDDLRKQDRVPRSVRRRARALHAARELVALPPRERQVLALYYYEELTQQQIAQVLGVTESRVSQIRAHAVARLRDRLQAPPSAMAS